MDYEKLTSVMRKLSLEAGAKIMEIYGKDDFEVETKSDDSPVTAADKAADAVISAGLRAAFPDVVSTGDGRRVVPICFNPARL